MRVTIGAARRRKKKRLFKEAKGNFLGRRNLLRTVKETLLKSRMYAFRDRRAFKREMRRLWITRITAACQMRGMNYSSFIDGLKKANLGLNRKSLSELAIHEPAVFDEVFELAKAARN